MSKQINIAIEGFDGSGKSTIAKHLSNCHSFEYHKSPSGNFAMARTFFDKTTENVDERIAFYLGDCIRISNLMHSNPKINFALDRYYYSTMAYHEAKYPGIMSKFLKYFDLLNPPDVVFLIHTEYDILRNRITVRNDLTSNDSLFLDKILFDKIYSLYTKYINVPVIEIINNNDMATAINQVDFELNEFLKKKKMKHVIIVSFDLIRPGEPLTSLAIGSMVAYIQSDYRYNEHFTVQHIPFNLNEFNKNLFNDVVISAFNSIQLSEIDTIALSCYIWSEYLINPLSKWLRINGFVGKIVLGGYQISYSSKSNLPAEYPDADIFILGYAELALLAAILMDKVDGAPIFIERDVDFSLIPSPYLQKSISIDEKTPNLRIETKRGCPYKCTFCAHRELKSNKVYHHTLDKLFAELSLFKSVNATKINVLDPVFNMGKTHLEYLHEISNLNLRTAFVFQSRLELIRGVEGITFLDSIQKINATIEFGVQSIIPEEYNIVNRNNDIKQISETLKSLNDRAINFEISLIYGLPMQTVDSFSKSIDFLIDHNCKNIKAFPLMLLKGTELFYQKEKYSLIEREMGSFNIPTVVASSTFTENEWEKMDQIASALNPTARY